MCDLKHDYVIHSLPGTRTAESALQDGWYRLFPLPSTEIHERAPLPYSYSSDGRGLDGVLIIASYALPRLYPSKSNTITITRYCILVIHAWRAMIAQLRICCSNDTGTGVLSVLHGLH